MAKATRWFRLKGFVRDFLVVVHGSNREIVRVVDLSGGGKMFQPSRELMEYGRAYGNLHPCFRKLALFISNATGHLFVALSRMTNRH